LHGRTEQRESMELSIVIPMHNEGPNVRPLIGEIAAACEGRLDYEVVVVDDGSRDDTPQQLQAAKQAHPRLRVLRHAEACGQSTAIFSGIHAARAPWIATLDGDGQNDPADIPRLFEAARSGSAQGLKMVAGNRRKRRDNWLRRLSSRVANAVRAWMLKDATPDSGCGLKVFEREAFLRLPYFDHMHRFLPALFRIYRLPVTNIEVNHRPRLKGVSKYGLHNRLWVGIVDLFGLVWLRRRYRLPDHLTEL
jgi:dolichol-phosphate mannosyltransferase